LSGAVTLTGNTTVGTTGDMTLSGAVGGGFSLTKIGAATLTLSASNAYSGGTVISSGSILAGNNNAFGTGAITINGGGLGSTGGIRTLANNLVAGSDFFIGGGSGTVFNGNFDLGGSRAITFSNNATFNGVISNGGLTISAAGLGQDITLGASNTYTGATTINGGDVILSGAGALSGSSAVNITASAGNARFDISGITADSTTIGSLAAASSANATVNLGGKTLIAGGDNTSTTFGGVISNTGSFVKTGTGTMTITRASTYTGATTISNGEIALTGAGDLSSATALNLAGATARFDISGKTSGETNGSLAGVAGSVVNLGSNNLTVGSDNSSTTFAGILTNTGSLTKVGTGTMTLSGANTFSGGSTLSAGVIRAANANALGTGSLSASSGTVLQVTNSINITNNLSVYSVQFLNGGNTLSGTITNNNTVYDVIPGQTNTISGFMTGSGGVELIGGGTLNITGTTNNYTGNTVISNGTLQISTLANSNTVSSIGVNNNVTLAGTTTSTNLNASTTAAIDYTGGNVTTDRTFVVNQGGGTINMASSSTEMTLTGSASGSGKLIVGEGTLILNGATNAFAPGSIQVDSDATLQLAANNQINDTTGLILNGGTFRTGTSTTGFSDTLGTLTLSASSTIDLGAWTTGLRQLTFANSSAITWTGTLTITNWQGVAQQSSAVAEILFGTGGLTSAQLGQVYWANQNINGGELIGGELVPVPEPRVYAAAIALLATIGWRERKRLLGLVRRKR
jgi:autotransporter-associated beta strand protein